MSKREYLEDPVLIYRREKARMNAKRAEALKGIMEELKAVLDKDAKERTMAKKNGGRKPRPLDVTRKAAEEKEED